ncbi:MAG: lipid-A-disaccharide synthase [Sedimentisphaerales bacterium]
MTDQNRKQTIFISAAEPSADRHCAALIRALRQTKRDLEFVGIGGPKMAEAGCALIENPVGRAAMTYNAFAHVSHYYRLMKQVAKFLATNKPNLVIVCDSPAFNFHIAKAAKKSGIKTLFYVAPQLWAWAPWRIRKLRKCCDKLCCLLPFEQDWFTSRGVPAEFVGNPLLDGLTQSDLTRAKRDYRGFNPANAKIAIVPGSRPAEVGTLWRPMQQIAIALYKKYPNATFTTVAVDEATRGALDSTRLMGFRTDYSIDSVYQTTRSCDFALVASGSATLQVASAGCPMVIMYQTNPILWHLFGRWLVTTKYLSLVNILAGKELVPEFMPYFRSIEPIIETVKNLFEDKARLAQTNSDLLALVGPLATKKAGSVVAQIATSMLP